MRLAIAVDFGSTYTKVVAIDYEKEELLGVTQSPSTVATDMTLGLQNAINQLRGSIQVDELKPDKIVASSSAAGGLNVVAAGLVKGLTTKAAEEAALGAGAKVSSTYAFGLTSEHVKEIEEQSPDLILLTGGTDGGNRECILNNALLLAKSNISAPVIVAGNKLAGREAAEVLQRGGKEAIVVDNVLPELDRLNVEPTRTVIRETFMRQIIHAKGLDKAQEIVGNIIMPTPTAVLMGARLLAEGVEGEDGIGDLVVVDIGGATTDVDSVAHGHSSVSEVVVKGLPDPYLKRTVEGDLGIRYNAETILQKMGKKKVTDRIARIDGAMLDRIDLGSMTKALSCNVERVPENEEDYCVDIALSCVAAEAAMTRHCGTYEQVYFPTGKVTVQHGKDLTNIHTLIGTGGVFAYGREPRRILQSACFDASNPESLRHRNPELFADDRYILFAVGLFAEFFPGAVLRIMKKHLRQV
jgi:uncharacterized protein (TIGR01319 family)